MSDLLMQAQAMHALEMDTTPDEWCLWTDKVEAIVGHSLDGDQEQDGYSLDFAYDAWMAGKQPVDYAQEVIAQWT